jgi:hypothetical protein
MWETVLFYSAAKPESRSSAQRNVLWILAFPLSGSALYLQEPWILPAVAEILSAAGNPRHFGTGNPNQEWLSLPYVMNVTVCGRNKT